MVNSTSSVAISAMALTHLSLTFIALVNHSHPPIYIDCYLRLLFHICTSNSSEPRPEDQNPSFFLSFSLGFNLQFCRQIFFGSMGEESSNGVAVKVVIINTEYIETDARSFKAVVQRLTGKDSKVMDAAAAAANGQRKGYSGGGMSAAKTSQHPHYLPTDNANNDFDCDRLLFNKELSQIPFDELYALYAQS